MSPLPLPLPAFLKAVTSDDEDDCVKDFLTRRGRDGDGSVGRLRRRKGGAVMVGGDSDGGRRGGDEGYGDCGRRR